MRLTSLDLASFADQPVIRVWRHGNYARFMAGLCPYYVTSWMQRVAVGWLAWELSHSNAWVGVIAAADLAPMMFLAPIAGALADRSNPLRQIKRMQLGLNLQALALAVAVLSGVINVWLLLVLSLVSGTLQPFYNSSRQTLVPLLVPRTDLGSAVSLDASAFQGSRFIGPAIAALSIPLIGSGGTCAIHVLGCLLFHFTCSRIDITPPDRGKGRRTSLLAEIIESFSYVCGHAGLRPLFVMMLVASIVARPLQDLLPGFAGGVLAAGPHGLAWLTSGMGVGAMVAAMMIAMRGSSRGLAVLAILSTVGLALSIFGFVATRHLSYAVMFGTLFGFVFTLMGVCVQVAAQVAVADQLRGRVLSLFTLIYRGTPAVGAVALGVLAEHVGLRAAFALSALVCLAVWLTVAPRIEAIEAALRSDDK